ncbi:MAG: acetylserotonin O-methyltransferase [Acidobacteriota bacterium]|nr:acetylserotonin O-methyltransferase [Acidobacteriota bacterium]
MEPFRFHVFVCDQRKPEGVPCCNARGSAAVIELLRKEIHARGLADEVQVTVCGSLGLCEHGPNMVVYPEGIWYSGVTEQDVAEIVRSHFEEGVPVERLARTDAADLRAEIVTNRDRMLAARRAREESGALPEDLHERIRAYQESRAILTALELNVFTALGAGASAAAAAEKIGADPRATEMLLNALTGMELLVKRDGVFRNTPVAARYFVAGAPDNARPGLLHIAHLWTRWSHLTESVRSGAAIGLPGMEERGPEWTDAFIAAMHRNAAERVPHVLRAVGAGNVRRMLDVGGGSGAYSIGFAQANPALMADILDLPGVEPIAQCHIDRAGLRDRVVVRACDFLNCGLGGGYDLVLASAICHMLSPAENRDLLRRCGEALVPGGRIVIQDFILEADKTSPRWGALFALNMLVGTRAGGNYSEEEYREWLAGTGFAEIRRVRLPGPAGLMIATRR